MMPGRKAIFLDIDGTLSYNGAPPCEEDVAALRQARAAGNAVLINTGRALGFLPESLRGADYLDGYLCGCGSQLVLHGETIFTHEVPRPILRAAAAFYLARPGRRCLFEGEDSLYVVNGEYKGALWPQVTREDDFETVYADKKITKLTILGGVTEEERALYRGRLELVLQSSGRWYEAILPGCGKGRGMDRVCEVLGIARADTIAIGDSENDLEMFAHAGDAVAMANATDQAMRACAWRTAACGEGGVARAVRALALGQGELERIR